MFVTVVVTLVGNSVLIETYWNVNYYSLLAYLFGCIVLIETYWNVNHYHLIVFDWVPPY